MAQQSRSSVRQKKKTEAWEAKDLHNDPTSQQLHQHASIDHNATLKDQQHHR